MNLIINYDCNNDCEYCFFGKDRKKELMTFEDLKYCLEINQQQTITLLGGEPTLHPQFKEFVLYIKERGIKLRLFTNGLVNKEQYKLISDNFEEILLNYSYDKQEKIDQKDEFIRSMLNEGIKVVLSYTISKKEFYYKHLLQTLKKYDLKLRFDLAHKGDNNCGFFDLKDMFEIKKDFLKFIQSLAEINKTNLNKKQLFFDCVLPLCIFNPEEKNYLYKHMGTKEISGFKGVCPFGTNLWVFPDLLVSGCIPMKDKINNKIKDLPNDLIKIKKIMIEEREKLEFNRKPDCDFKTCIYYKRKKCQGGCLN